MADPKRLMYVCDHGHAESKYEQRGGGQLCHVCLEPAREVMYAPIDPHRRELEDERNKLADLCTVYGNALRDIAHATALVQYEPGATNSSIKLASRIHNMVPGLMRGQEETPNGS